MAITTLAELVEEASSRGVSIGAIVREREAEQSGRPEDDLDADMRERLGVMRSAVDRGGLRECGPEAALLGGDGPPRMASARMNGGETICGEPFDSAWLMLWLWRKSTHQWGGGLSPRRPPDRAGGASGCVALSGREAMHG